MLEDEMQIYDADFMSLKNFQVCRRYAGLQGGTVVGGQQPVGSGRGGRWAGGDWSATVALWPFTDYLRMSCFSSACLRPVFGQLRPVRRNTLKKIDGPLTTTTGVFKVIHIYFDVTH